MRRKEKPAIKGRAGKVFALDYGRLMGVPYYSCPLLFGRNFAE